jgi:hypothetical protein
MCDYFSQEVPHHSVKGTPRLTLFAEDAEECPIINRKALVQLVDIQLPDLENVIPH